MGVLSRCRPCHHLPQVTDQSPAAWSIQELWRPPSASPENVFTGLPDPSPEG